MAGAEGWGAPPASGRACLSPAWGKLHPHPHPKLAPPPWPCDCPLRLCLFTAAQEGQDVGKVRPPRVGPGLLRTDPRGAQCPHPDPAELRRWTVFKGVWAERLGLPWPAVLGTLPTVLGTGISVLLPDPRTGHCGVTGPVKRTPALGGAAASERASVGAALCRRQRLPPLKAGSRSAGAPPKSSRVHQRSGRRGPESGALCWLRRCDAPSSKPPLRERLGDAGWGGARGGHSAGLRPTLSLCPGGGCTGFGRGLSWAPTSWTPLPWSCPSLLGFQPTRCLFWVWSLTPEFARSSRIQSPSWGDHGALEPRTAGQKQKVPVPGIWGGTQGVACSPATGHQVLGCT